MNLTVKEVLERYGPALAMVAALIGLVVFIPGNAPDTELGTGASSDGGMEQPQNLIETGDAPSSTGGQTIDTGGSGSSSTGSSGGGPATSGGTTPADTSPSDTAPAETAAGPAGVWGPEHGPGNLPAPGPDTPCREDGAMPAFSQYADPCVPHFSGDNGGATAQGVSEDAVKVVWYKSEEDPATQAALQGAGAGDSYAVVQHSIEVLFRYFNLHNESYGREVKLEIFEGTGPPDDDNVLRADATAIAQNHKPFAVFHHSVAIGSAFSEELAAKGVICFCTSSNPRSLYLDGAPYLYSILPILDEFYSHAAEYVGKRLNGLEPKFAGSPPPGRVGFNDTRKFGLVFLEGTGSDVNPRIQPVIDRFHQELAQYGAKLEIAIGYQYELAQAQTQSTNIMAQLINAGVNHVIFMGDPLYPVFLTQAAENQQYHPEWMITGTLLQDTSFFGRTYNRNQWSHAFGISPLWVFAPKAQSSGYSAFHHIDPGGEEGVGINVVQSPIQRIFTGIHRAGPRLTPETFAEGLVLAEPLGGTVNAPLVKFTRDSPSAIKDFVEVWYDPNRRGMDEQDREGLGMVVKANGGARYQLSQWPQQPPTVFGDDPDPITTTDKPEVFPHSEDGHTHDQDPPCRSCG